MQRYLLIWAFWKTEVFFSKSVSRTFSVLRELNPPILIFPRNEQMVECPRLLSIPLVTARLLFRKERQNQEEYKTRPKLTLSCCWRSSSEMTCLKVLGFKLCFLLYVCSLPSFAIKLWILSLSCEQVTESWKEGDVNLIPRYSLHCWLEQSSGRAHSTCKIRVPMSAGSTKWNLS